MRLTVLLFASYADALGERSLHLTVEPGARVADVLAAIRARAGAEALPPRPLVAVNEQYVEPSRTLSEGDVVAVLPPVAGG